MGLVGFLNFSNWLATWGESMPMSWFYLPNSSFWGLSLWLLFLGWVTLPHVPRINRGTTIAGAFLLVGLLACTFWRTPPKDLVIHSIAVGHGTAILVEDPSGRVVLYDGGSMTGGENASKKISHVLWYLGISAIDEIIISHADSDHFNAITGILDKFKIGIVSVGPSFTNRDDKETASFFENLNSRGIPLRKVYSGLNAISGPTSFEILYPDQEYNRPPNQNAASLVIRIGYMGKTILLTGDLEPPGTEFFLASSSASPVSILMAPHHGSPSANPEKLWRRLNPGFVFSSEGDEKRSKTPGGLWGKEIPLWKTQDKGMITIKINESGISVKAFKSGEQLRVKEK
jgi:competence protein ComEC